MKHSLTKLEQTLNAIPDSVVRYLRIGISRRTAELKVSNFPTTLPVEVFDLYEWRNGTNLETGVQIKALYLMRNGCLIPLERAIEQYQYFTENEFEFYTKFYFPLIDSFGEECLVIDCNPTSQTYRMVLSYE